MTNGSQRWIVALLLVNIALTTAVLVRDESGSAAMESGASVSLERDEVVPYARAVIDAYNSHNAERLYALYHPDARSRLTRDEVADQLERLHALFGPVQSVSYLNNLRIGEKGGESYYQALFSARVEKPGLDKAQLMLHLIAGADGVSLYGMRLNAAQP